MTLPLSFSLVQPTPVLGEPAEKASLEKELKDLLAEVAIMQVSVGNDLLFYSTFLLSLKKNGTCRPILNLKLLNKPYVWSHLFSMETLSSILRLLSKGMWATSINLTNTHTVVYQSTVSPRPSGYCYRSVDCRIVTLLFGLSTFPRVSTQIIWAVSGFLCRNFIVVFVYLEG